MTSLWQSDSTVIGRVRVRSRAADPLAAQRRVASLLKCAAIRPSRLSPSAILIVRKLRDPLPGTRWLDTTRVHLPPEWGQAATRELDRLAAAAVRPLLAAVPASAEAVVFRDRAELLACLAEDWLCGTPRANWWWLTLVRCGDLELELMREWERSPELVPAIIEVLQRRSQAVEFVRRLPDACTAHLLASMLQTHGLKSPCFPEPLPEVRVRAETPTAKETVFTPPRTPSVADPWLPWVPEASAGNLSPTARLLLAYALLLRRAPDIARARWFTANLSEWWARATSAVPVPGGPPGLPQAHPPSAISATQSPAGVKTGGGVPSAFAIDEVQPQRIVPTPDEIPKTAEPSSACEPHPLIAGEETPVINASVAEQAVPGTAIAQNIAEPLPQMTPSARPSKADDRVASVPEELSENVETIFGGAFFLLNVALYLNLYGDFTRPCHPGLELNIWDFVALFGIELAGGDFSEDPIWTVLAGLAGRGPGQKPAEGFRPPAAWRIPVEWLDAFPEEQPWHVTAGGERLRLMHPAGFCAVDVPLAGRSLEDALAQEMTPYPAAASAMEKDDRISEDSPLARWIAWMAGYLRARLRRALGSDDAAQLLYRIPARLRITPAHLHVLIRLDRHPIEVRLAALDRDPGWIPAAGRYVTFTFD